MIQWIALAVAVDANSKASHASDVANQSLADSPKGSLVIIQPFDLVDDKSVNGWDRAFGHSKLVLDDKPWGKLSIHINHIKNMREYKDLKGKPFVRLTISEYADIWSRGEHLNHLNVPGTLEEVAGALS